MTKMQQDKAVAELARSVKDTEREAAVTDARLRELGAQRSEMQVTRTYVFTLLSVFTLPSPQYSPLTEVDTLSSVSPLTFSLIPCHSGSAC